MPVLQTAQRFMDGPIPVANIMGRGTAGALQVPAYQVDAVIDQLKAEQERERQNDALNQPPVIEALLAHVQERLTEAESARNSNGIVEGLSITDMLLESRDRRGSVHTAKMKKAISEQNLPDYYEPVTDQKCRDAASWWYDATAAYGTDFFRAEPTEIPELPDEDVALIRQQAEQEAVLLLQTEQNLSITTFNEVLKNAVNAARQDIVNKARSKARRMETEIKDQFQDCNFLITRDQFRQHLIDYGTAYYWGPYPKMRKVPTWENGKRTVAVVPALSVDAPHPLDIFPAPWMTEDTDHGYVIRRMNIRPGALGEYLGIGNGWKDDAILAAMRENATSSQSPSPGESERRTQEGKDQILDKRGQFYWFVGYIPGNLLKDHGADFADESREYHVHVCWIGNHLLCVRPNWWDLELIPCHKAVYDPVAGSWYGLGIPMKMRKAQDKANAIAIPMMHNINYAGGHDEVETTRMVDPKQATTWHAHMVVGVREPEMQTSLPAIRHIDIPLNSDKFSALLKDAYNDADEQSGVRKYTVGSDKVAGAGRTRGGLAMLIDASAKTLKFAMYNGDRAEGKLIEACADYNNTFSDDPDVKGDVKIVTHGASGFFIEELQLQQLERFIDRLMNPTLIQLLGPQQVIAGIRELGERMRLNVRYIPTEEELETRIEELKATAESAAAVQPNKGGANTAGTPPRPENQEASPAGVAA